MEGATGADVGFREESGEFSEGRVLTNAVMAEFVENACGTWLSFRWLMSPRLAGFRQLNSGQA